MYFHTMYVNSIQDMVDIYAYRSHLVDADVINLGFHKSATALPNFE